MHIKSFNKLDERWWWEYIRVTHELAGFQTRARFSTLDNSRNSLIYRPNDLLKCRIHPFDNYVTTTLFSTWDHLGKGFQVFFSWTTYKEAEHSSSTHAWKTNLDFLCLFLNNFLFSKNFRNRFQYVLKINAWFVRFCLSWKSFENNNQKTTLFCVFFEL